MNPRELAIELRSRAKEAGFDAMGVAVARALDRDGAVLEEWLARSRHAGMQWMERDPSMRADPLRLLPGCKSVVALATNYWSEPQAAGWPDDRARVALYARGRDYHKVLSRRLKRLAAWLDESCGATTRTFVDTGPVLERGWAELAGIGWIGKNANLLTREMGSWVLLGEMLTTAELEPDPGPHADHCGTCNECLQACPTGAIVQPGVVDSSLCISYWTIEHRGPVPVERREGNGDWIFGCDVCQDVCPWNRSFARPAEGDPFESRDDLQGLDPAEILALDEATFRARYSGTPLMRAKWEGMRRNACIVLGNRGASGGLPALEQALRDEDPVIRGHAAWAVGAIGGPRMLTILESVRDAEADPGVREEIQAALARVGESRRFE